MKKKLLIILFFVFFVNSFNLNAVAKTKETYEYLDLFGQIFDRVREEYVDEVTDEDWQENAEIQEQNVLHEPEIGEETTKGEIWRCVICDEYFTGWGNNPDPIKNYGECCNACNTNKVIPERMRQIINHNHLGVA